jgi:hypothetical protein
VEEIMSSDPRSTTDATATTEAKMDDEPALAPTRRVVVGALVSGLGLTLLAGCITDGAQEQDPRVGTARQALSGTRRPAALLSLLNRLDLYVSASSGHVWHAVSFDGGNTWPQPWVQLTGDGVQYGTLSSAYGPAAAASGDGRVTYVVGRGSSDAGFYIAASQNYRVDWGSGWGFGAVANCGKPYNLGCNSLSPQFTGGGGFAPVAGGIGSFLAGPAVATSGNGQTIYIAGLGTDATMFWAKSTDGGLGWTVAWSRIPNGSGFLGGPGIATSGDGQIVYVVGQGGDGRMYWAKSINGGASWAVAWGAIPYGTFPAGSIPAVATSADGNTVYVVAQGSNQMMYYAQSIDGGNTWTAAWGQIPQGTFPLGAGPAVTTSWDASTLHVFAQGTDGNIWRANGSKSGGGVTWNVAWTVAGGTAPA